MFELDYSVLCCSLTDILLQKHGRYVYSYLYKFEHIFKEKKNIKGRSHAAPKLTGNRQIFCEILPLQSGVIFHALNRRTKVIFRSLTDKTVALESFTDPLYYKVMIFSTPYIFFYLSFRLRPEFEWKKGNTFYPANQMHSVTQPLNTIRIQKRREKWKEKKKTKLNC